MLLGIMYFSAPEAPLLLRVNIVPLLRVDILILPDLGLARGSGEAAASADFRPPTRPSPRPASPSTIPFTLSPPINSSASPFASRSIQPEAEYILVSSERNRKSGCFYGLFF